DLLESAEEVRAHRRFGDGHVVDELDEDQVRVVRENVLGEVGKAHRGVGGADAGVDQLQSGGGIGETLLEPRDEQLRECGRGRGGFAAGGDAVAPGDDGDWVVGVGGA